MFGIYTTDTFLGRDRTDYRGADNVETCTVCNGTGYITSGGTEALKCEYCKVDEKRNIC